MSRAKVKIDKIDDNMYVDDQEEFGFDEETPSVSWVNQFENELGSSIDDVRLVSETSVVQDEKYIEEGNDYDIDAIKGMDYKKMKDIDILKYQKILADYLRKYIMLYVKDIGIYNTIDYDLFLGNLQWLYDASKYLSMKLKLPRIKHIFQFEKTIPRSSYTFCNFGAECMYNYDPKKKKGCIAQHYVHNVINADIDVLIKYINRLKEDKPDDTNIYNEVLTCMTTISYVFKHMYDELSYINYYNKDNLIQLHKERRIVTKKKKHYKKKDQS